MQALSSSLAYRPFSVIPRGTRLLQAVSFVPYHHGRTTSATREPIQVVARVGGAAIPVLPPTTCCGYVEQTTIALRHFGSSTGDTRADTFVRPTRPWLQNGLLLNVAEFRRGSADNAHIRPEQRQISYHDLRKRFSLSSRDMLVLDSKRHVVPSILPLKRCVLFSISDVNVVISKDELVVLNAGDPVVHQMCLDIESYLHHHEDDEVLTDFELKAMDAVLSALCDRYARRIGLFRPIVARTVEDIVDVSQTKWYQAPNFVEMHKLVPLEHSISSFESRMRELQAAVADILANDEDMLEMRLTAQAALGPDDKLPPELHAPVELLFETYHREVSDLRQKATTLRRKIESAREIGNMDLDTRRNHLISLNVYIAMGGVALTWSAALAGMFGMNLVSGLEEHPSAFYLVAAGAVSTSALVFAGLTSVARSGKVGAQKINEIRAVKHIFQRMDGMAVLLLRHMRASGRTPEDDSPTLESGLTRAQLRSQLTELLGDENVSRAEVELLFDVFDVDDNDSLQVDEYIARSTDNPRVAVRDADPGRAAQ